MPLTRQEICESAGRKILAAGPKLKSKRVFIGLDGFVDSIIAVVAQRHSPRKFDAIPSIAQLGEKISAAAGRSANFEMVVKLQKLGGNGPIMANALSKAGLDVSYIGMLGHPKIYAVFEPLAKSARVISIAEPGFTDALEFEDGKVMLGKYAAVNDVNWENLLARVGKAKLQKLMDESSLIGILNWTMLPYMTELWAKLHAQFLKKGKKGAKDGKAQKAGGERLFFADLCDPAKRSAGDLRKALKVLSAMQRDLTVILGLNLSEAMQVAQVIGVDVPNAAGALTGGSGAQSRTTAPDIEQLAQDIRAKLKLGCVVVHPRTGAAAATESETASFRGPFVQKPKLSTGAGDNFNAGFCLGRLLGLTLEESLAAACGTSGYYVRNAASPTAQQLGRFLGKMPEPE